MVKNQIFSPITTNTVVGKYSTGSVVVEDNDRPFTFKQWLYRSRAIKKGFEYEEYNNYVKSWNAKKTEQSGIATKIKADYIGFIRSLSMFFTDEEKKLFNDDYDLENYLNVEEIIPHCARKLRDIMIYYQHKREAIKRAKLKYNLVGTYTAVERMLHDYLLRAFTKHGKYIKINDPDFYNLLPELKPLNTTLEVKIEELYDDTDYMDKTPDIDAVDYYGTPTDEALAYYAAQGYDKDEVNWLLGNGFASVVGDNPFSEVADESSDTIEALYNKIVLSLASKEDVADLPVSAYIDFDKTNTIEYYQKELTKKYLGEDQYAISGGYYVNKYIDLSFDMEAGNNWISFPSGEGDFERIATKIAPLPLSATTLLTNDGAIGASSYINADKIFISYGTNVEGAWLKDTTDQYTPETMVCNIYANRPFSFKFPYCDYGLSGEAIEWSGPGIDNSNQILYTLLPEEQRAIMSAYWTTKPEYECRPVALSQTTLIDCGAHAGSSYFEADRISIREGQDPHDYNPNGVYTGKIDEAFLYRVSQTDVPVIPGRNYIAWPYQNTTVDGMSDVVKGGCEDVCISGGVWRKIFGSRAGYGLFDSDIIYKLDGPDGSPIECAFLSGVPFTNLSAIPEDMDWASTSWTDGATGCFQVGRYGQCHPNGYFTFIWLDEDTPMDDVVFHIEHRSDCPYLNEKKFSLFERNPDNTTEEKDGITFKEWKKCTCGAIRYSPMGHPGKKFDDYLGYADCIFADTTYPLPFDKNTWFGLDKTALGGYKNYQNSSDFAWYQLTGTDQVEPDIGWGKGHWQCGAFGTNPDKFILKKGVQYKYFRSAMGHSDSDIMDGTVPSIIITHKQSDKVLEHTAPRWMKAVMDSDGNWNATTEASEMIIRSDDTIVYDHIDTEWWCITGNETFHEWDEEHEIEPYRDEDWLPFCEYNVVPVSTSIVTAIWPKFAPFGSADFPVRGQLDLVEWTIDYRKIKSGDLVTRMLSVAEPVYLMSVNEGTLPITAVGYSNRKIENGTLIIEDTYHKVSGATGIFNIKFEPPYTVHMTSASVDTYTVTAETIGFPLNVPLSGWDYLKNTPRQDIPSGYKTSGEAHGARPVWVVGSNIDDYITHGKAINKWGGSLRFVEDYVPIMQPPLSKVELSAFAPITYETSRPIKWDQPIEMMKPSIDRRWCKLNIDATKVHNLSAELSKPNFIEMVAAPTDESSDMVLRAMIDGEDVTVNYWANGGFTWEERVQDISDGVAPTGGEYRDVKLEKFVDANREWANLSSRHFPTVAVAPVVDNFYRKEDVGGYVIPQELGATVAIGKNVRMKVDVENRTSADDGDTTTDMTVYAQDNGLSLTENNKNIVIEQYDPMWMKSAMVNGQNAGYIKGSNRNQQFMSYQTTIEARNLNNLGIMRNGDLSDPWTGPTDLEWISDRYDQHFTKQLPIAAVRKTYKNTQFIKEWTSDIYGYSYGILKDYDQPSEYASEINKKRYATGDVYIRRNDGGMSKLSESLTCLKLKDNEVYSINIYFDVLVLQCVDRLIFYKLVYDKETKDRGFNIMDNSGCLRIIDYSVGKFMDGRVFKDKDIKVRCAGCWHFPDKDRIDTVFLVTYDDYLNATIDDSEDDEIKDNWPKIKHYGYVIDQMNTIDFNSDFRVIKDKDKKDTFMLEDIDPDALVFGEDDEIPEWYENRFSVGGYTLIGPFMDFYNNTYTIGFQLRCDDQNSKLDEIGRFIRSQFNNLDFVSDNKMVKKVDFPV
jgi:hypothetical protein